VSPENREAAILRIDKIVQIVDPAEHTWRKPKSLCQVPAFTAASLFRRFTEFNEEFEILHSMGITR
jgi:hypothetical protein